MKRFSVSLLLITAVLLGTAKVHAAVILVGRRGPAYYAPYYGGYYGYRHPWVRRYRAEAPRPVYYAPARASYYYAPAPSPLVVAPILPFALGLGFHIR